MAVLLSDNFDRADNAADPGAPQTGGPYTVKGGTWGISSNQLYLSNAATPTHHLTFPAAINLDMAVTIATANTTTVNPGLTFRRADDLNMWLIQRVTTNALGLYRANAGTATQVGGNIPQVAGDRLRVVAFEKTIWVYVNGILHMEIEDHWVSTAGSGAGLRNGGTATARFDDLVVSDAADRPNSWGSTPAMEAPDVTMLDGVYAITPSLYKGRDTRVQDEAEIP